MVNIILLELYSTVTDNTSVIINFLKHLSQMSLELNSVLCSDFY